MKTTKKAKVAVKARGTKAPKTPTAAHGAAGQGRAAKATKTPKAATGANPAATASRLAEERLSEGARADLARVRASGGEHDPALDAAFAQAGKTRATKVSGPKTPRKASLLDLAAEVLAKAGKPLGCKEIVEQILAAGTWTTNGKTPAATLYAAIIREIASPRRGSRFRKVGKGQFEAVAAQAGE
jgi:hypothetical protein